MHSDDMAPFVTEQKISTKEKLYEKLQELRTQYRPYLEEHAPQLEACTKITYHFSAAANATFHSSRASRLPLIRIGVKPAA